MYNAICNNNPLLIDYITDWEKQNKDNRQQ